MKRYEYLLTDYKYRHTIILCECVLKPDGR